MKKCTSKDTLLPLGHPWSQPGDSRPSQLSGEKAHGMSRTAREGWKGWTGWGFRSLWATRTKGSGWSSRPSRSPGMVGWWGKTGYPSELSWCMQGGLVEVITQGKEQPTTSACLMIQTTSAINPGLKVTTMCMEWRLIASTNMAW